MISLQHWQVILWNAAVIADLFRMTTDAFAPWIQPVDNSGQILSPWIISDEDVASELVAEWLRTIDCLFTAFAGWISELYRSIIHPWFFQILWLSASVPSALQSHLLVGWSAWLSSRMLVSGQRSFTILRSTCSWWVTTYVGKPSAIGQPTRST